MNANELTAYLRHMFGVDFKRNADGVCLAVEWPHDDILDHNPTVAIVDGKPACDCAIYQADGACLHTAIVTWGSQAVGKRRAAEATPRPQPQYANAAEMRSNLNHEPATAHQISDGYYSVTMPDDGHVTIRIETAKGGTLDGRRIAAYLRGSDNLHDYTSFAFITPNGGAAIWKRYQNGYQRQIEALRHLLTVGLEGERHYGELYAIESGRCWRCGRMLTVPASVARGLGPDCARMLGVA